MYKKCKTEESAKRQKQFAECLMQLMEKKNFSDITITELSSRMNAPRNAFYRYFDSLEDVLYSYLDDILLYLVHYATVEEAQKKWNERKRRINWDKIVVINSDRNGMTDDLKSQFEKLPYKKVMFTNLPNDKFPSSYYLTGSESEECLGLVPEPIGWFGKRRTDSFDFVEFLNNA